MSRLSSIDFHLQKTQKHSVTAIEIINSFFNSGWQLNDHNRIWYFDDDDWLDMPFSAENSQKLMGILEIKSSNREKVGIGLTKLDNSELVGGSLSIDIGQLYISFLMLVNRKTIMSGTTDVNWYLENVLPVLQNSNLAIREIVWNESRD